MLARKQLFCAFQPIVDLTSGVVFGYEALLRGFHPEFESPPALIEHAIAEGYCGELGRELRRLAVDACDGANLFLNIHPDEFREGWLVRPDDPLFRHEGEIHVEITESVPLSHYHYCHSILAEIRSRGMRIAVDDLGAGYSNLKYIADLAPEIVKLDRALISNLTVGTRLHTLVTSIVDMCHQMGAKVIAEGIETSQEFNAVVDAGAHFGQGYYIARPARELPKFDWDELTEMAGSNARIRTVRSH